jgi:hypothetical protein
MRQETGIMIDDARKVAAVDSCVVALAMLRSGYTGDFWVVHGSDVARQRVELARSEHKEVRNGLAGC